MIFRQLMQARESDEEVSEAATSGHLAKELQGVNSGGTCMAPFSASDRCQQFT
jgi:hypothetical protein